MASNHNAGASNNKSAAPSAACLKCGHRGHNTYQCIQMMLVHESIDSQLERIYTMLDFLSPPQTEGDKQLVKILTAELSRITMQFRLNSDGYAVEDDGEQNIKIRHRMAKQGGKISDHQLNKCRTRLFP